MITDNRIFVRFFKIGLLPFLIVTFLMTTSCKVTVVGRNGGRSGTTKGKMHTTKEKIHIAFIPTKNVNVA
jgi:hypothetical protein